MTYDDYLASPAWAALRKTALDRDGHRCRVCNSPDELEAHHRRYPPPGDWLADTPDNLTTLCRPCHRAVHVHMGSRIYAAIEPTAGETKRTTPAVELPRERLPELGVSTERRRPAAAPLGAAGGPAVLGVSPSRRNQ